jgi:predicted dehydrogenase
MTDSFTELIFTNGVIHLDRKHEQLEVADASEFSYPRNSLVNSVAGKPGGSTASAVQHFVDCVMDETAPLVDLESSVHVTEVLVAIQESCTTGHPVLLIEEHA